MKRTQNKENGLRGDNRQTKWVIARVHPTNDHFQFLHARKWVDWGNHPSEAAIFDSRWAAYGKLSTHNTYGFLSDAFVSTLS